MKKIIFNEEQTQDIISNYQNGILSSNKLAEKYGCSKTVIMRILKENRIEQNKNFKHKYRADYNKFEIIDSAEKAYWLGFLAADGCNYRRTTNATVVINIHQKDISQLEKFRAFMQSNAEIKTYIATEGFSNNTPMCKIALNSVKLSDDLTALGIVPKKSLILKPPKIAEEYSLPFILGYFDGDGSIFQTSNGEFGIDIVGTQEILAWINSLLNVSSRLEKRNSDKDSNNFYIRCGGFNKPYQIMKKLYDSVNVHLDRKYEIYKILETVVLNRNIK